MFSDIKYLLFITCMVSADFFNELSNYLKPAAINSEIAAQLGKVLVESELAANPKIIDDLIPVDGMMVRYIWQLAKPLELLSSSVCPDCVGFVSDWQKGLVDHPATNVMIPMSCALLQVVKSELVPVCGVSSIGALLYFHNSKPKAICEIFCSANSTSKRNAAFDANEFAREVRNVFKNLRKGQ
ncbi:unnamed protein product [Bursaphelenchus okinawaensis]|uniref:Uncharacterized protein n=1 Tax=Bursaphelenchus okinawaensis TaxID=465554 RepID=A0A811KMZ4_9BILA|nr:unnamed protein product [Bursaphelenchus okinawaensis]CAG9106371.1 unnamed protein product [Bursaphelenchus okinawaensis]